MYAVYYLISLPLRRQERARLFEDLLWRNLKAGRTPEQTIVALAAAQDRALGLRFHLLAAHVELGMRLTRALERVPRLLPPAIQAVIKVGEETGSLAQALAACRRMLCGGISQMRSAENYLPLLAFVFTPLQPLIAIGLGVYVLPQFKNVFSDYEISLSPFALFVFSHWGFYIAFSIVMTLLIWLCAFIYIGGPRLTGWIQPGIFPLGDWLALKLPWKRDRLARNFAGMLAILLDAGVPEEKALCLAGQSTANFLLAERARRAADQLKQGISLIQAMADLDTTGELRWRLATAAQSHAGFCHALAGWIEALEVKATQQEQVAAQLFTTFIVAANGLMVGLITTAIFLLLINLIEAGVLW
jgi:type IV pilus assembly protein PilC